MQNDLLVHETSSMTCCKLVRALQVLPFQAAARVPPMAMQNWELRHDTFLPDGPAGRGSTSHAWSFAPSASPAVRPRLSLKLPTAMQKVARTHETSLRNASCAMAGPAGPAAAPCALRSAPALGAALAATVLARVAVVASTAIARGMRLNQCMISPIASPARLPAVRRRTPLIDGRARPLIG